MVAAGFLWQQGCHYKASTAATREMLNTIYRRMPHDSADKLCKDNIKYLLDQRLIAAICGSHLISYERYLI